MALTEPAQTGLLLTVIGLLLAVSALTSRATRFGIPIVLLLLGIGMLAGSEGVGGIHFADYHLAFRIGTVALVLILFDGGLNTPRTLLREIGPPAVVLATVGVVLTAALMGAAAHLVGFAWGEALLLGAIVSSTDAAAIFSVLRGGQMDVRRRVAGTLEAESGLNDPMAVVLTIAMTHALLEGPGSIGAATVAAAAHMVIGGAVGWAVGRWGRWLVGRLRPSGGGLTAVLTVALAFLAFGLASLAQGSGFLAVFVAGGVFGNGPLPYRGGVLMVHDALGWLSQVVMFLVLGLLVFPSRVIGVAWPGLAIALLLALVIRPLVAVVCLLPFRYAWRERLYIGWMGLRGAVPIVLGIYPIMLGVQAGSRLFDIVFFIVVASVLLQGGTARWVTNRLGLGQPVSPPAPAVIEFSSRVPLTSELVSYFVRPEAVIEGSRLADIPFPPGSGVAFVVRGSVVLGADPEQVLRAGDHAYVYFLPEDRPLFQLLFGRPELD